MTEVLQEARHRTAVRGSAYSFLMPWDEIVKSLQQRIKSIPRDPECLQYMLRLHLKVAGTDFHQHLKQVHLRPGVLILLLQELFRRKHEAFMTSFPAQRFHEDLESGAGQNSIDEDLERAVHAKYPETEAHLPLEERKGAIPQGMREDIEASYLREEEQPS